MDALHLLVVRISALVHLLIYLHAVTQLARAYEFFYIHETVEDRVKVTINGLYKVVHGLSITAKMYDLK